MVYQVVQVTGSLLILAAFTLSQLGRLDAASYRYLVANLVGSIVLTATAVISVQWGFIMLEAIWALVSLYGVVRRVRGLPVAGQAP